MLRRRKASNLEAKHHAFSYQLEAFEAVKDLSYAAIFHEQGLGKTKIGLDVSLSWLSRDIVDSVMIVTKKSLIDNWQHEIGSHSYLRPRILGNDRNANFFAFNSPSHLYLIHYEAVLKEYRRLGLFLKTRRVGVLLDESHRIKNPSANISKAFHDLSDGFCRKLILTGTPVANRPYDLWSQIYFLDGGLSLGDDYEEFRGMVNLSNDLGEDSAKAAGLSESLGGVFTKIQDFTVRKTKQTADIVLPRKLVTNVECPMEPRQAEIYRKFQQEMAAVVVAAGRPVLDDAELVLKRLMRLVQVASNPALVDGAYMAEPGKLGVLRDLVYEVVDSGDKVIVWTGFVDNAEYLRLELRQFEAVAVHGAIPLSERRQALDTFKASQDCKVLVATPGAAKEGLTLTVANHAIFFDRSFSLDDYLQAQDRIHRISQTKPCRVMNLIGTDTVDEWVDALLSAKHLAAELAQGDISREEYDRTASYVFGEMIKDVLQLTGT